MPVHKAEAQFSFQPTAAVELELKVGWYSVGGGWEAVLICCIVQLCPLDIGTMADVHGVLQGFL